MTMSRLSRRVAMLVVVTVVGLAACGESNEVGDPGNFDFEVDESGGFLATTTTAAEGPDVPTATTVPSAPGQPTSTTAPPRVTETTQVDRVSAEVLIASDATGQQFDPRVVRVFAGSIIRFTNIDTSARSIVFDDSSVDSGSIPPGESWEFTVDRVGTINYHDGTRPYAVGTIESLAR